MNSTTIGKEGSFHAAKANVRSLEKPSSKGTNK